MKNSTRPLVAHIIHHLGTGGMENGLVNLIKHMPAQRYRHLIICLKSYDAFRRRLPADVEVIALNKRDGNDIGMLARLYRLLRERRPDIVHTRNLATLECQTVAALAGVRARVHGEHGRDIYDLDGSNRKYIILRRLMRPFVKRYIAVSADLADWLLNTIRVNPARLSQIYNGVDASRFAPGGTTSRDALPAGFVAPGEIVIGSVGRFAPVKGYVHLAKAFVDLVRQHPSLSLKLVLVGDGSERAACETIVAQAGLSARVWFAGDRSEVPALLRAFDIFVLPSLGEGISNTILEAMASGLPIVATHVGGNPELVHHDNGILVPAADHAALADAIARYAANAELRSVHGRRGRAIVETRFSIQAMVQGYLGVYDDLVGMPAPTRGTAHLARAK